MTKGSRVQGAEGSRGGKTENKDEGKRSTDGFISVPPMKVNGVEGSGHVPKNSPTLDPSNP
jgi:hypothetical protein